LERLWRAGNATGSDGSSVDVSGVFQLPMSMLNATVTFDYTAADGTTVTAEWPLLALSEGDVLVDFEFLINTRFGRTVVKTLTVDSLSQIDYLLDYPANWLSLGQTLNAGVQTAIGNGLQNAVVLLLQAAIQATNN